MLDFILEIIFEILIEGCFEIAGKKKHSIILRFICGLIIGLIYGGLICLFLFLSIQNKSILLFIITCFIALIFIYAFICKYKKIKNKNHQE